MKVVVVDAEKLPEGVDFPPLSAKKYVWEQYLGLSEEEIAERCWRADIVVALRVPVAPAAMGKMSKLKLLITAGDAASQVDEAAARAQGVELLALPDVHCAEPVSAQDACNRIAAAIDHYLERVPVP